MLDKHPVRMDQSINFVEPSEIRKSSRKVLQSIKCHFGNDQNSYPIFEMSAHGFSFSYPKDQHLFHKGVYIDQISIQEGELELVSGTGEIIHVTEYDFLNYRIGVRYIKKNIDVTFNTKVRISRHIPQVELRVILVPQIKSNLSLHGKVEDFTAFACRVTLFQTPSVSLEIGDEITISIHNAHKRIFYGKSVIIRKKEDSAEITIRFSEKFINIKKIQTLSTVEQSKAVIVSGLAHFKDYAFISENFKALVCDWRMFFAKLKFQLDQEEKKEIYILPEEERLFLQSIEKIAFPILREFIKKLNTTVDCLDRKQTAVYKSYYRENLVPFLRYSPLVASIIDKNRGYSGDFQTIKQFFENPYCGKSFFGKLLNKFICTLEPVTAHIDRIQFLFKTMNSLYTSTKNSFRILSLGSGPAQEVFDFLKQIPLKKQVHVTLLDLDAHALSDFSERLQFLQLQNLKLDLINCNVLNILRKKTGDPILSKFDFTYCAGMLDYFKDNISKEIIAYLIKHTDPGGTVCVTNVHRSNIAKHFMDYGGGWEIIHRDEQEFLSLFSKPLDPKLYFDKNRTNLYALATLP